jgi:stalled ribosome rescue protein Dom34
VKAHVHPTAQHGSDVRAEHEFFAAVCAQMEPIDAVLVTGSKTVLADLRHYVEKHRPTTARRIAAYEVVDHPTDNQLAAFGREFFERQAP